MLAKDIDAIRSRIDYLAGNIAKNYVELCDLLMILVEGGEDHPLMHTGLTGAVFRRVAARTLAPEAALALHANEKLLDAVARLPIAEQQRLASGEPVTVPTYDDQGEIVAKERRISKLTSQQIDIVFDPKGAIRPFTAQRKILEAKGPRDVRRSVAVKNIRYDADTEEIVCGMLRIPVAHIASVLAGHFEVKRKQIAKRRGQAETESHADVRGT
jgi:hypothetical protein